MKTLKKIATIFTALAILLSMASCGSKQDSTVKIGLLSIDDSLPFFMAEELGLYEKHGVKVELYTFSSAADKEAAFTAGELDGDMTDLVVAALLNKGGTACKIVCNALGAIPSEGRFVLLSSPNSGITSPEGLIGEEIAVGDNTIVHYLSYAALLNLGLSKDQIKTTNIPALSLRLEALLNDTVKAAVLPDPLASLAVLNGANIVFDDTKSNINLSQSIVLFSEESISKKSDSIAKCLDAVFEAMEYINDNPEKEDVRNAILEFTSVPDAIFENYKTPSYSPKTLPSVDVIRDTFDWMLDMELLDRAYEYNEIVCTDFN